jgi:hypothetical protein
MEAFADWIVFSIYPTTIVYVLLTLRVRECPAD